MMDICSPTWVILVSEVWHASQWKPEGINVIKPHVIFQWFTCVCCTPDGQFLRPCSALCLQVSLDQNNKDLKQVHLHSGGKQVSVSPVLSHFFLTLFCCHISFWGCFSHKSPELFFLKKNFKSCLSSNLRIQIVIKKLDFIFFPMNYY